MNRGGNEFHIGLAGILRRMVNGFFALNRRTSRFVERFFPQANVDMHGMYEKTVARYMNSKPGMVVVDVGGGKNCPFAKYRSPEAGARIICLDISMAEMQYNMDVDEKRVADIMRSLPCDDGEADLIVSRSVLEHVENLSLFVKQARRVLKEGGYFIHVFPSKFAPFALLNQALPRKVSPWILDLMFPEKKGILGFPAVYDRCYASAIRRLLEGDGFEVVNLALTYRQSGYFEVFFPAYLASVCYEAILQSLSLKDLCAYVLV
ncbi:MAG: class I SAM-dependent methyltransferase, partial [Terriglobia bacterium]